MKIDKTVKKETLYILYLSVIFSLLTESVYLIIGRWSHKVILGNILGLAFSVGNFLLMGITIQKALTKEEKEAKSLIKLSQSARLFLLFICALIAYLVPIFDITATVIPLLFPRIAIALKPLFNKGE